MPLYEYMSKSAGVTGESCRMCSKGFELRRPVDRAPLEVCPLCKHPVKKVISLVNTPTITKPMSTIDAKNAGFTVLEKRIDGNYEKQ
jgi:putative FmdB family regulatory protein